MSLSHIRSLRSSLPFRTLDPFTRSLVVTFRLGICYLFLIPISLLSCIISALKENTKQGPGVSGSLGQRSFMASCEAHWFILRCEAVTCSSLIASCTAGLQWQQAVEALDAARGGLRLDGIAWGTAVAAWASGSMWEASLRQAVTTLSNWEGLSGAVTSTVLGSCLRWQAQEARENTCLLQRFRRFDPAEGGKVILRNDDAMCILSWCFLLCGCCKPTLIPNAGPYPSWLPIQYAVSLASGWLVGWLAGNVDPTINPSGLIPHISPRPSHK